MRRPLFVRTWSSKTPALERFIPSIPRANLKNPLISSSYLASLRSDPASLALMEHCRVSHSDDHLHHQECSVGDVDQSITQFLDDNLFRVVSTVNLGRAYTKEYRQVVLLLDAFDTRPFRLPWPTGTVIFLVAPGEVHEKAEAYLEGIPEARVPPGCLLRRVAFDLLQRGGGGGGRFQDALCGAGYRGDRLSAWCLQGTACFGIEHHIFDSILAEISNLAAFESLVFVEWPAHVPPESVPPPDSHHLCHDDMDHTVSDTSQYEKKYVENQLAGFGFLGTAIDLRQREWTLTSSSQTDSIAQKRTDDRRSSPSSDAWTLPNTGYTHLDNAVDMCGRYVAVAQQKRLSDDEMRVVEAHRAVAEDTDEDFLGHFS